MDILKPISVLIDFVGSLVIIFAVAITFFSYIFKIKNTDLIFSLHYNLASSLVFALTIKSAAALLKTIVVATWEQFLFFLAIVGLRFFLGFALKTMYSNNNLKKIPTA